MSRQRIAVFLDRDGTINEEVDYLRTPDQVRLISGAGAAVRRLNEAGILTCVISNQSGVARGFLKEEDLVPIHAALERQLLLEGARVDRIYYCPHHPTEGKPPYKTECDCRKPKPGMLRQAAEEYNVDLRGSFVVGDRIVDVQTGISVGATTILVLTGYGRASRGECEREGVAPDRIVEAIDEAVEFIVKKVKGENEKTP